MVIEYPKMIGGMPRFVRMPMIFTEDEAEYIKDNLNTDVEVAIPVGKWIAVEVHDEGYSFLKHPVLFDDEASCQVACNGHNKVFGWSEDEANDIISMSMGLKPWPDETE